ncbi:MAG: FAD-dependent oxidoreductase [Alphaproteobacteria bacterium]|nr:FAD-dependent oxidoreductase [Alphaproteobacteria bacterium]
MTYVIVGAGPAGVAAAETLAKTAKGSEIILVGGEPEPPYSRMAIPYVLTGSVGEDGTYLRKTENWYEDRNIRYIHGRAESLSTGDSALRLARGEEMKFEKLLISTGARPIKPPVPGLDLEGVHHCWTLEDVRNIKGLTGEGKDVILIGAGFIGSIILEALLESGSNLTVVEAEDRMVPRMMNQVAGNMIKAWCEKKGVTVLTSTRVAGVAQADGGRLEVDLGGNKKTVDLVVVAAGVKPNADFLEGSGIEVEDGILVDNHLKTSADNVYAAGDCAKGPDYSGGWSVHAIQPTAVEHGRIAALNMAGQVTPYKGSLQMNVLDTAGLISTSVGLFDGVEGGEEAEDLNEQRFKYIRLTFKGDYMIGALTLGRTDQVGVLRGLIHTPVSLGPWKQKLMADPAKFVEAYIDRTQVI